MSMLQQFFFVVTASLALLPLAHAADGEGVIAAILPLTGNIADQGEWARRGFDIALEDLARENVQITLKYEDSKADPALAVQAYKSLTSRAKPLAVLSFGSGVGLALTPLVNSERIIQMGIATATPKYRSVGDYTFRNFPSAEQESSFIADVLADTLKVKDLAILHIQNDYGAGTAGAVEAAIGRKGIQVRFKDAYDPGTTDFRPLLLKLKQAGASVLYLASYPTDGALLLRQAKSLGLKVPVIASTALIGGKEFFSVAGDAAEGLLVVSSPLDEQNAFFRRYRELYSSESTAQSIYAARAYDGLRIISWAMKQCEPPSPECIRDRLFSLKNYRGASGTVSFDEAGDISTNFALYRVKDRGFVDFAADGIPTPIATRR